MKHIEVPDSRPFSQLTNVSDREARLATLFALNARQDSHEYLFKGYNTIVDQLNDMPNGNTTRWCDLSNTMKADINNFNKLDNMMFNKQDTNYDANTPLSKVALELYFREDVQKVHKDHTGSLRKAYEDIIYLTKDEKRSTKNLKSNMLSRVKDISRSGSDI